MFNNPRYTTTTLTRLIDLKKIYTFSYEETHTQKIRDISVYYMIKKIILIPLTHLSVFHAHSIPDIAVDKGAQWFARPSSCS